MNKVTRAYRYRFYPTDEQKQILARVEEDMTPLPRSEQIIGIDLGLKTMVVTSAEQTFDNPRYFARDHKKLARAQRKLSSKQKDSNNRERQRRRVAKIHATIADRRRDYQHRLSTKLVRENQTIVVESLAVKHLMQHPTLAKAIADVGRGEFVRQLDYKAQWYGRSLIKINRFYPSSKTCSCCSHVLDSLSLGRPRMGLPQVWLPPRSRSQCGKICPGRRAQDAEG